MSTEVQTMADLDDGPRALRTPLYPIISLFGVLMVIATFLTWADVDIPDNSTSGPSVTGLDAGGWGLAALITGGVIIALGILGYLWNPFSDPEAWLIALFGLVALIASLVKIADPTSLFTDGEAVFDYFDQDASAGVGLWLVLLAAVLSLLSAGWILYSRPRAEARL